MDAEITRVQDAASKLKESIKIHEFTKTVHTRLDGALWNMATTHSDISLIQTDPEANISDELFDIIRDKVHERDEEIVNVLNS